MAKTASTDPSIAFIFRRPFAEQVAFFRGKLGHLVPTATWRDVWQSAHDRAFMVAGAAKADLLADLAEAVDQAIAQGETLQEFRKRFFATVDKRGWHGWTGEATKAGRAWRTRIIYQTNLATSYAAGRLAQLRAGGYRYWIYRHTPQEHPRLQHLAWDGLTLPPDHPFWQTHFPPGGWGCKCRVVGADGPQSIARLGGQLGYTEPPAGWNVRDAKGRLPGIDEGWDYMPGATSALVRAIERKARQLPPLLADQLREDVHSTDLRRAWDEVVERAISDGTPHIEYAVLLDASGKQLWTKRGGNSVVVFTTKEVEQMKGGLLVHNHPAGSSLSVQDLSLAGTAELRRIYAVANDRTVIYAASVDSNKVETVLNQYGDYDKTVRQALLKKISKGKVQPKDAERWHNHVVNVLLAKAGLLQYRVIGTVPQWVREVIHELYPG
jgi:hypothetical protein